MQFEIYSRLALVVNVHIAGLGNDVAGLMKAMFRATSPAWIRENRLLHVKNSHQTILF
jgi:hypothetical protein